MATKPAQSLHISRRAILTGAGLGIASALVHFTVDQTSAQAATPLYQLSADGIAVASDATGTLTVSDGSGVQRLILQHFMIKDSTLGQQRTYGGTPSLITLADGRSAIRIAYKMSVSAATITVVGRFDVTSNRLHMRWDVTGSSTLTPTGFMFSRALIDGVADEVYSPMTLWNRDAGGGIPFETNDGGVYQDTFDTTRAYFSLTGSNPSYTSATWLHAPATVVDAVASTDVSLVIGEVRPAAARSVAEQRVVGAEVWTDQPFNIWDDSSTAKTLHGQVTNGTGNAQSASVSWWARDFSGTLVGSGTNVVAVPAGGAADYDLSIPAGAGGIVFAEVSATIGAATAFARTNLATLSEFAYQAGAESILGLANYPWLLKPTDADVLALLKKIGVKRIRIAYEGAPGLPVSALDAAGIHHNVELSGIPIGAAQSAIDEWADENVAKAIAAGAEYFEVGNELDTPWMSGEGAAEYVRDGLIPVRDRLAAAGSGMKVLNAGTGGGDYVWIKNVQDAGGWDLIDGLAIHPGRGNFTPDFAPDPADWSQGTTGTYWNYLGALRKAREIIDTSGSPKELWLTEAYVPTRPNVWWNDTYRHAAENVLLSIALAFSVDVRGINVYQLHDSTVHHPQEADPTNVEFHSGLMNRDLSAKPSLLAYATAARAFDRATFVRWLTLADDNVKGLLFSTPSGPLSVLWTRHDGYVLNADHGSDPSYATPEPWVDPWPTKTAVELPATEAIVRQIDAIGTETALYRSAGGHVTATLDGAPRLYWGLTDNPDGPPVQTAPSRKRK